MLKSEDLDLVRFGKYKEDYMKNIEVKILNPEVIKECEKMMVCSARLTQRGHKIKNLDDFMELYNKSYTDKTANAMVSLPHPTIQKFGVINVVIVGGSRRFLAQITRHQNEVKFMSASLQYSDYSDNADFFVPYEIICKGEEAVNNYLDICKSNMEEYKKSVNSYNIDHDTMGYIVPHALRNILIISATPYQWKHMIQQRTCNRNTQETQYIMLKIWEALYNENPILLKACGPFCMTGHCKEGKMCCGRPIDKDATPTEILKNNYPLLYK